MLPPLRAASRAAQRTGAQLPAAREPTTHRPAAARGTDPNRAAGGWEPRQAERRRPVSCSALLGGALRAEEAISKLILAETLELIEVRLGKALWVLDKFLEQRKIPLARFSAPGVVA